MLFPQIAFFILVISIFGAYRPDSPSHDLWFSIIFSLLLMLILLVIVRVTIIKFLHRLNGVYHSRSSFLEVSRLELYIQVAALLTLAVMFTSLEIKANLLEVPIISQFEILLDLIVICIYFLLIAIEEWACYPLQKLILGSQLNFWYLIHNHLRLLTPMMLPWFLVTLLRDVIDLFLSTAGHWLDSPFGDLMFIIIFFFFVIIFFPPLVKFCWGCRSLSFTPERQFIELVFKKANINITDVLAWPALQGYIFTSGILGFFPFLRYLLISPNLIEILTAEEIAGVAAHEAGHIKYYHFLAYIVFFISFFIIVYALAEPLHLLYLLIINILVGYLWGIGFLVAFESGQGLISIFLVLPLIFFTYIYIRFVMFFFIRHFERQADLFALNILGTPTPLIKALEKIKYLSAKGIFFYSRYCFFISQRIQILVDIKNKKKKLEDQTIIIRRACKFYILGILFIIILGLGILRTSLGENLRQAVMLRIIETRLYASPRAPRLRMSLGVVLFEQGEEEIGIEQVRLALALSPKDSEIINSLAWMLSTANNVNLREPQESLFLASQAVTISPAPHIWDTLAEALFINGQCTKAAAAARAALAAGPRERRGYYLARLKRFDCTIEG